MLPRDVASISQNATLSQARVAAWRQTPSTPGPRRRPSIVLRGHGAREMRARQLLKHKSDVVSVAHIKAMMRAHAGGTPSPSAACSPLTTRRT